MRIIETERKPVPGVIPDWRIWDWKSEIYYRNALLNMVEAGYPWDFSRSLLSWVGFKNNRGEFVCCPYKVQPTGWTPVYVPGMEPAGVKVAACKRRAWVTGEMPKECEW